MGLFRQARARIRDKHLSNSLREILANGSSSLLKFWDLCLTEQNFHSLLWVTGSSSDVIT